MPYILSYHSSTLKHMCHTVLCVARRVYEHREEFTLRIFQSARVRGSVAVILETTRHTSLYFDTAVQHMASCCVGTSCSCLPEAVRESWSQSASAPTITAEPRSRPEVGPGRGRDHEKPPRSTLHCEDTGHWPPAHWQWLLYDAMTMPQSGE